MKKQGLWHPLNRHLYYTETCGQQSPLGVKQWDLWDFRKMKTKDHNKKARESRQLGLPITLTALPSVSFLLQTVAPLAGRDTVCEALAANTCLYCPSQSPEMGE